VTTKSTNQIDITITTSCAMTREFWNIITGTSPEGVEWINEFVQGGQDGTADCIESHKKNIAQKAIDDGLRVTIDSEEYFGPS
jgi:hypothetical protein